MDGRELPRPPRRVPAGAGTLTQVQTSRPQAPQPPPRRPWIFGRILAGFIVLLIIVAGGATAGWWLHAQSEATDPASTTGASSPASRVDTAPIAASAGPAVVRVLATTCAGTGEATGALIEGDRVLTAASALKEPLAIVIVTPDNRIRRANLLGTSPDGVAVLRMIGQLDAPRLQLATDTPEPNAERALIGYTAAGKQTIQPIGTTKTPTPLASVMNAAKLGGPVVNESAQLVGLVVGDTVASSTIIGVDKLRQYAAPKPTGLAIGADATCVESRGPQGAIVPELQVARTPLALEAQKLLGNYLTLENRRDFPAVQPLYSEKFKKSYDVARDRRSHKTTYFFAPELTEVSPSADGGAFARMTVNALFSPTAVGADGLNCNRLDYRYRLVREGGKLVIDAAKKMVDNQSCDSE